MFQTFDYISKASTYFGNFITTNAHDSRGVERS